MPTLTPAALEFASKVFDAQRYEMGFVRLDLELAEEILAQLPSTPPPIHPEQQAAFMTLRLAQDRQVLLGALKALVHHDTADDGREGLPASAEVDAARAVITQMERS